MQKTGVFCSFHFSCHTANRNGKAAFAAAPKQDKNSYLYTQPVMETLKYTHCGYKRMSIAVVLLEHTFLKFHL